MPSRVKQNGFLMLEVLIALLIFSVGVLGMVTLQSISSANSVNSEDRSTAALLANDIIAELWAAQTAVAAAPATPADYGDWQTRVGKALRDGAGTLSLAANTATVTITWKPQGRKDSTGASYSTQVVIQ